MVKKFGVLWWILVVYRTPFFLIMAAIKIMVFVVTLVGWGPRSAVGVWNDDLELW